MTMFRLLVHYNKENAALYKEQKAERKAKKEMAKSTLPPMPANGFVPGQQSSGQGFPVPGRETNWGLNVPDQNKSVNFGPVSGAVQTEKRQSPAPVPPIPNGYDVSPSVPPMPEPRPIPAPPQPITLIVAKLC